MSEKVKQHICMVCDETKSGTNPCGRSDCPYGQSSGEEEIKVESRPE